MSAARSLYEFKDYREYLRHWIRAQGSGRGHQARLAKAAGISSTMMSLILKEEKHLTMEQAGELCDFFAFNDRESDYFFCLVEFGRAGSSKLRSKLATKIHYLQQKAQKLSARIQKDVELSEDVKAVYYSNFIYTAIMNLVAVSGLETPAAMAAYLRLPESQVAQALAFLRAHGLIRVRNGRFTFGAANTHVGADSPFVLSHHRNWRLRGLSHMELKSESDLFYTCPMSLSEEAAAEIRRLLPSFIERVLKIVRPSPSERVGCLNLDWFTY
ncbi:MAG: TIGR02147 family protein [Bdellovibrionales bacterium]